MADFLSGFQVGANVAGDAMNRNLRMQELRSQEAHRRSAERDAVARMGLLLEKRDMEIQEQADMAKAVGQFQARTAPEIPGPDGTMVPNPNQLSPEDAAFQTVLPVVAKYQPDKVPSVLQGIATAKYQTAQEKRLSKGEAPGMASPLGKEVADYQHFIQSGNTEAANFAKAALIKRGTDTGFAIEFDADGKVKSITQGPKGAAGGLTPTALGDIQKQTLSTDASLSEVNSALKTITNNPGAIGLLGMGVGIAERAKGQLRIGSGAAPVANARHKLGLTFTQIATSLRVDSGNMSLYERRQLEKIGDPTRWQESPQTAFDMMTNIQSALIGKKLRLLQAEGKKPDDNFLLSIPQTEIPDLVHAKNRLLSIPDASRWYDLQQQQKAR